MFIKKLLYLFAFMPLLCSCSAENKPVANNNDVVTIGTFNLEWLGDGIHDAHKRKAGDYKRIAKIIRESGADIFALQEVENDAALSKVTKYLSGYKYFVADCSGAQNVAFLYDSLVSFNEKGIYTPLQVGHERYRPGLIAEVKARNFDFVIMDVHLKSTSSFDKTEVKREEAVENRTAQAEIIRNWLDSALSSSKEKDYIILGDFNDSPNNEKSDAFEPLINDKNIEIITKDMKSSGKFSDRYVIDNIIVSKSAMKRCFIQSLHLIDLQSQYSAKQLKGLSDHSPVVVQFDIKSPDND